MKTKNQNLIAVTLLFAAALLFSGTKAHAFITNGVEWPGSHTRVPVYVSDSLNGNVPYDGTFQDAIDAVQAAIDEWNDAGNSEFQFFYAGTTPVSDIADDGINAVIFKDEQCPWVAGCYGWTDVHNVGTVTHGFDIVLYSRQNPTDWPVAWTAKEFIWPTDTDIQGNVTHELGHALGLAHSNDVDAVMGTAGLGPGGTLDRTLNTDDINGINAIYGNYTCEGLTASNLNPVVGETVTFALDYPEAALKPYYMVISLSGTQQGIALNQFEAPDSRILPLDDLFPWQVAPSIFIDFMGLLDVNGQATARFIVPSSQFEKFYFSVITFDSAFMTGVEDVGVDVELTVQ